MRSQKLLEIRKEVVDALKKLKERLGGRIFLFGSYAKGTHTLESDVDVVVVSEVFRNMSYPDRVAMVRTMLPQDIGFDIIALTPEEFEERREKAFFKEISKYWIEIK